MLRFLLSPAGLIVAALLAVVHGGVNTRKLSTEHIPERSELRQISGEIVRVYTSGMQSLKTGKVSGLQYNINIKQDNGEHRTLYASMHTIKSKIEQSVSEHAIGLVETNRDQVWDLRTNKEAFMQYDDAARSARNELENKTRYYMYFLAGGALGFIVGIVWHFVRRRSAAATI